MYVEVAQEKELKIGPDLLKTKNSDWTLLLITSP